MKYLLPCECGLEVPVSTAQAGAEVTCACGRTLPVPTLLELKRYRPAPQTGHPAPRRSWTPLQGGMFSGGIVVVIVAGGLAAYFGFVRTKLDTKRPPDPDSAVFVTATRGLEVDQLWDMWTALADLEKHPLWRPVPRYIRHRRLDERLRMFMVIALAVAAGGVALSAAGVFWKSTARRPRRATRKTGPASSRKGR